MPRPGVPKIEFSPAADPRRAPGGYDSKEEPEFHEHRRSDLLLTGLLLLATVAANAAPPERIVVVLGENDPATSAKVVRRLGSCIVRTPVAVVSLGPLRVEQDFTTETATVMRALSRPGSSGRSPSGVQRRGFSLSDRLTPETVSGIKGFADAVHVLAEALAPVGPTSAILLVSPHIVADWKDQNDEIPYSVIKARKALQGAGLTLVAVNTSGQYDPGVKALTEFERGSYLRYSQADFGKQLVSTVCAPGR
jgi:hypothetical protein